MKSLKVLWENFLELAKEKVGAQTVANWFKSTVLVKIDEQNKIVTLQVANNFIKMWLKKNYLNLFENIFYKMLEIENLKFNFLLKEDSEKNTSKETHSTVKKNISVNFPLFNKYKAKNEPIKKSNRSTLNPEYTFNNFIVGENNHLAYSAAYAISQDKAHNYNPLFIYGKTGLGKTHLMHCIGNELKIKNPGAKIVYKSSDSFVDEFIRSVKSNRAGNFREKYTKVDLLLIDDVQFFSQKEQTQEAFFNIFNKMHEQKKQIVLSSDMPPGEIKGLQDRLQSRMAWGLIADISFPSIETRTAIVLKKAEKLGIRIDYEIAKVLASQTKNSIREMEGMLTKLVAINLISGGEITLESARKILQIESYYQNNNTSNQADDEQGEDQNNKENNPLTPTSIVESVSKNYGLPIEKIISKSRNSKISSVRHIGAYLIKKHTASSLKEIGASLGGRNHSTVINSISRIANKIKIDKKFANEIQSLEKKISPQID